MAPDNDSISPPSRKEKAHAFPDLNGGHARNPDSADDRCGFFKALYQSPDQCNGGEQAAQKQESEEQVYNKGFQRGFAEGRQDASRLCQQEIAPNVKEFLTEFKKTNECLLQIEANSCKYVLIMALCIAEKILGDSPQLKIEDLAFLNDDLKVWAAQSYQLKLTLNNEDYDILSQFMDCEDPQWRQIPSIHISGHVSAQRGGVNTMPRDLPVLPNDMLVQALEKMLAGASTM